MSRDGVFRSIYPDTKKPPLAAVVDSKLISARDRLDMKNLHCGFADVNLQTMPVTKALPAIKAVAKDKRLTQKAKLVFLGIYGFTGSDNSKAWPSKKALADTLGMHHQTVTAAIQELVQLEYLATSKFGGKIVFHLRPTVEVTAQVVQVPWNARPENPKEKNQRTLGNGDARLVNSDARVVATDDKGIGIRDTNKGEVTVAGFEPATNRLHSDGLANRGCPSPIEKMDQLLAGARTPNAKLMMILDARKKASLIKKTFKDEEYGWGDHETERQEFVMLRDWVISRELEVRGYDGGPC